MSQRPLRAYTHHADTPTCGRPTNVCQCGHHLRCHEGKGCVAIGGPRDACKTSKPPKQEQPCQTFDARRCMRRTIMQNGCCKDHGGKTLSGIASPHYKHGLYSRHMPPRAAEMYDSLRDDPQRLTLTREIDLLRMQLAAVMQQMYEQDVPMALSCIRAGIGANDKARAKAFAANKSGDTAAFVMAMQEWEDACGVLHKGLDPMEAEQEGRTKTLQYSLALDRLLRTENTVKLAERGMVPMEAVLARERAMIDAWKDALESQVRDMAVRQALLTAIARQYAEFAGRRHPSVLAPAGESALPVLDAESASSTDR